MCLAGKYYLLVLTFCAIAGAAVGNVPIFDSPSNGDITENVDFDALQQDSSQNGHFVVIGAFRAKENATKLVRKVRSVGFAPKFFFNKQRKLYYVYIFIYENLEKAYKVSNKLREVNFITDAWVFSSASEDPLGERFIAQVQSGNKNILTDVPTGASKSKIGNKVSNDRLKDVKIPKEFQGDDKTKPEQVTPSIAPTTKTEPEPTATGQQKTTEIKVDQKLAENSVAIKKLAEAKQGDLVVFDNILFHKNASVLRKLSRDEMGRLENVMDVNPNLRIKIHGHTNGDFKGDVFLLAESDSRFFKLSGKNKVTKGDDILLSQKRAEVIKRYLVEQGVAAGRIETKGWGHKKMLYPKDHFKASQNRRVEIEILENK